MPTLLALDRVLTRPTNQSLGRYQLLGRLGAGGMAEVFVARCGELAGMQSLVAIKRILPHLAEDEGFVGLFRREAQISLRLHHRAIARVIEVGRADNAWFLAMELVPGESLAHLLVVERERGIAVDPRVVAWVGAEIALALHHAHTLSEAGAPLPVIHRDVSPQNLLLGFDGAAKLIDFGVARCAQLSDMTRTGTVRGKLAYASPEQLAARPLDGRSDLFSLAVVLYEWLARRPLFLRDNDAATVQAVQAGEVPPLPRAPRLFAVLARALSRAPERRFPDGEALAEALLDATGGRAPAPERLVAAHLHDVFPDREVRWQAIIAGRSVPIVQDAARGETVPSGSVLEPRSALESVLSDRPASRAGTGTLARHRRRRAVALAIAGAAGFAALMVGWVRRDPGSPASGVHAVPVISEAQAIARPVDAPQPQEPASVVIAGEGDAARADATPSAAAPAATAQRTRTAHAHRRINRAPAAVRRAIVEELEPSPYQR
jgi:serine/threonine protein kinase